MATRALVGFITDGAELISTYNHYDGYPENLGVGLDNHYSMPEEALKVASMGYISYMDPETGEIDAKYKEPAERTDLDMDFGDAMLKIAEVADSYGADYVYIYDIVDSEWVNVKMYGTRQTGEALQFALQNLDGTVFPDPVSDLPAAPDQIGEDYNAKWKSFINEESFFTDDPATIRWEKIRDNAYRMLKHEDGRQVNDYVDALERQIKFKPSDMDMFIEFGREDFQADFDDYIYDRMDL